MPENQDYKVWIDGIPLAVFVTRNGRFEYINSAGIKLLKVGSLPEFLGTELQERIFPNLRTFFNAKIGSLRTGQDSSMEMEEILICMDGSLIAVQLQAKYLPFDSDPLIIYLVKEIQFTKVLGDSNHLIDKQFLHVVEESPVGIVIWRDEHVEYANPSILKMFGYHSITEVLGHSIADYLPQERREEFLAGARAMNIRRNFVNTFEATAIQRNGSEILLIGQVALLQDDVVPMFIAFLTDITQQKKKTLSLQRQVEESSQRLIELEALRDVSTIMRKSQSRSEMIDLLLKQTLQALQAQGGALALLKRNHITFQGAAGRMDSWKGNAIVQDHSPYWNVIRTGHPEYFEDHFFIPAGFDSDDTWIKSGMVVPLKSGDLSVGLLVIGYSTFSEITDAHRRLVTVIADMAGNTLYRMDVADMLEKMVNHRTSELDAIYKITAAAITPANLKMALQNALEIIIQTVHAENGAIFLVGPDGNDFHLTASKGLPDAVINMIHTVNLENGIEAWVYKNNQAFVTHDLGNDHRIPIRPFNDNIFAFSAMPMRVGNRVVGILEIGHEGEPSNLDEITLLSFTADHLGLVIENALLHQRAEEHAILDERARLGRELHDSVTQLLYSATLFAEGGRMECNEGDLPAVKTILDQISLVSQQALREMRLLIYQLRSPEEMKVNWIEAIQERLDAVEKRAKIQVNFSSSQIPTLPIDTEEALYRIVMESLNNAIKHAMANKIIVRIKKNRNKVIVSVEDDGQGFDPGGLHLNRGIGLVSIHERAASLKGQVKISSSPGHGTRIQVAIPITHPPQLISQESHYE